MKFGMVGTKSLDLNHFYELFPYLVDDEDFQNALAEVNIHSDTYIEDSELDADEIKLLMERLPGELSTLWTYALNKVEGSFLKTYVEQEIFHGLPVTGQIFHDLAELIRWQHERQTDYGGLVLIRNQWIGAEPEDRFLIRFSKGNHNGSKIDRLDLACRYYADQMEKQFPGESFHPEQIASGVQQVFNQLNNHFTPMDVESFDMSYTHDPFPNLIDTLGSLPNDPAFFRPPTEPSQTVFNDPRFRLTPKDPKKFVEEEIFPKLLDQSLTPTDVNVLFASAGYDAPVPDDILKSLLPESQYAPDVANAWNNFLLPLGYEIDSHVFRFGNGSGRRTKHLKLYLFRYGEGSQVYESIDGRTKLVGPKRLVGVFPEFYALAEDPKQEMNGTNNTTGIFADLQIHPFDPSYAKNFNKLPQGAALAPLISDHLLVTEDDWNAFLDLASIALDRNKIIYDQASRSSSNEALSWAIRSHPRPFAIFLYLLANYPPHINDPVNRFVRNMMTELSTAIFREEENTEPASELNPDQQPFAEEVVVYGDTKVATTYSELEHFRSEDMMINLRLVVEARIASSEGAEAFKEFIHQKTGPQESHDSPERFYLLQDLPSAKEKGEAITADLVGASNTNGFTRQSLERMSERLGYESSVWAKIDMDSNGIITLEEFKLIQNKEWAKHVMERVAKKQRLRTKRALQHYLSYDHKNSVPMEVETSILPRRQARYAYRNAIRHNEHLQVLLDEKPMAGRNTVYWGGSSKRTNTYSKLGDAAVLNQIRPFHPLLGGFLLDEQGYTLFKEMNRIAEKHEPGTKRTEAIHKLHSTLIKKYSLSEKQQAVLMRIASDAIFSDSFDYNPINDIKRLYDENTATVMLYNQSHVSGLNLKALNTLLLDAQGYARFMKELSDHPHAVHFLARDLQALHEHFYKYAEVKNVWGDDPDQIFADYFSSKHDVPWVENYFKNYFANREVSDLYDPSRTGPRFATEYDKLKFLIFLLKNHESFEIDSFNFLSRALFNNIGKLREEENDLRQQLLVEFHKAFDMVDIIKQLDLQAYEVVQISFALFVNDAISDETFSQFIAAYEPRVGAWLNNVDQTEILQNFALTRSTQEERQAFFEAWNKKDWPGSLQKSLDELQDQVLNPPDPATLGTRLHKLGQALSTMPKQPEDIKHLGHSSKDIELLLRIFHEDLNDVVGDLHYLILDSQDDPALKAEILKALDHTLAAADSDLLTAVALILRYQLDPHTDMTEVYKLQRQFSNNSESLSLFELALYRQQDPSSERGNFCRHLNHQQVLDGIDRQNLATLLPKEHKPTGSAEIVYYESNLYGLEHHGRKVEEPFQGHGLSYVGRPAPPGTNPMTRLEAIADAMLADPNLTTVNLSIGLAHKEDNLTLKDLRRIQRTDDFKRLAAKLAELNQQGKTIFTSAGNSKAETSYGALHQLKFLALFSPPICLVGAMKPYGITDYSSLGNERFKVTLAAIPRYDGTSFSSPEAAALHAILSREYADQNLTSVQKLLIMMISADPAFNASRMEQGLGVIDKTMAFYLADYLTGKKTPEEIKADATKHGLGNDWQFILHRLDGKENLFYKNPERLWRKLLYKRAGV